MAISSITGAGIMLSAVRLEASSSPSSSRSNGGAPPPNKNPPASTATTTTTTTTRPLLSVSKPSRIVRTESNVRIEQRKKPDPPCVVCRGSGRVECYYCQGKGRTNHVDVEMLPRGEWPKWCRTCGGSGLGNCSRCLGTGEYRYIMGFHFMRRDTNETEDGRKHKARDRGGTSGTSTAADLLLSNEDEDIADPT